MKNGCDQRGPQPCLNFFVTDPFALMKGWSMKPR